MSTAAKIYTGRVMHLRRLPNGRTHQFRYALFRLWLDIDAIPETLASLRTVGHNRFNLYSFRERDHGARDGSNPRPWVEVLLAAVGVARPASIMLYCFPRVLGYEFNPLAMYCAYDDTGELTGVVYQVRNTDGDLSPYTFNIARDGLRHSADKAFYVSPFIDAQQKYHFTLSIPGDELSLRIRVDGKTGLTLIATENADARPLTDASLLRLALTRPLMTLKVTAGIYWQAVRLRLKGARFYKHPGNDGLYTDGTRRPISDVVGNSPIRPQEGLDTQ